MSPTAVVIRSPSPSLVGNPCEPERVIIRPVTVTVWSPIRGSRARAPALTIVGHVLPVAFIIKVFDAGYLGIFGDVLIAGRPAIALLVVVGITFVGIVIRVTPVIVVLIAIRIVVVYDWRGDIGREIRNDRFRSLSRGQRNQLTFADLSGTGETCNLTCAVQHRHNRIASVIDADLIQTGLREVYGAVGSGDLVGFA